ncbi:MAG TPA: response regulator [Vicinamibacterales bacterium]|nr:response regulator [Vicinamibacterales bacterium]
MDIRCARCGTTAIPAGHEDARAFYQCEKCNRVWMVHLTSGTAGRTQTPQTRVLVVDDADALVSLLQMWLEDEGYGVATATSGRQALDTIANHDPDIVLLDLIIPPPDGFALCSVLRRRPHPPEIIVMTGLTDPVRMHDVEGAGIFTILRKPLTQDAVLDAVSRAQRHRWGMSERRDAVQ